MLLLVPNLSLLCLGSPRCQVAALPGPRDGRRGVEPVPGGAAQRAEGGAQRRPSSRFLMYLGGAPHLQACVWPAVVVQPHGLVNRLLCLCGVSERCTDSVFKLQDAVDPFGVGIFCAMIYLGHTHLQAALPEALHVVVAAVLAAAIGMMNRVAFRRQVCQGPLQGLDAAQGFEAVAAMVPDDLPGVAEPQRGGRDLSTHRHRPVPAPGQPSVYGSPFADAAGVVVGSARSPGPHRFHAVHAACAPCTSSADSCPRRGTEKKH